MSLLETFRLMRGAREPRQRVAASGFTLIELMIVIVIMVSLTLFTMPKIAVLRERMALQAARQQIASAIATARAAAIQKGRPSFFRLHGSVMAVSVTINNAGGTTTLIGPINLDSSFGVTASPKNAADSVITYESRGFASPRLTATGVFQIVGKTRRDSVCVTTSGSILPRGCAQ